MKKPSFPFNPRVRRVACTVSAAALMLGVSHAATVGFNFQCNYCGAHSYSGAVVTAPAFGIGTNAWESLPQMDTGYGCTPGYYTLNQVVDTTSLGNGLNPLPNGAITVTWSAYTANVSGFGGYTRSGPHYKFGGNGYLPGNEQVYWGFLRDGVNFGPGSSGGDNNQLGYSIDLAGLKTLFTNSPFAIQLIGSADSMQYLTNAFIIDATANTTQSVVYPSTPPVADVGDTAWIRGIGGGLSTTSEALDTDHVQIIGNRAAHGGDKVTGYNWASCIAGFIVTDKPVVSMSPNSVLAFGGDTPVVLSAYAVGVPPLSYQWRRNGQPIPGATLLSLTNTTVTPDIAGVYDLVVTNLYGKATSSLAMLAVDQITVTAGNNYVVDSNPNGITHDGLNTNATWLASSTDGVRTRSGVMQFASASPSQIVVSGQTNFDATAGTVTFWMRSAGVADPGGNPAMLFDRAGSDGLQIVLNPDGTVQAQPASATSYTIVGSNVADNKWHHIAVVFDQPGIMMGIYVDGTLFYEYPSMPQWQWQPGQEIELGLSHTATWQAYDGLLDDVRFYNQVLTDADIASIHSTGALANPGALVMQLNFDTAPVNGISLQWQCPDAILQSADSAQGPYSDLGGARSPYPAAAVKAMKFYRYHGHTPAPVISNPYLM